MPADDYDDPSDIDEIREYLSDADEYDGDPPGYEEPPLDQTWDCVITVDNLEGAQGEGGDAGWA